MKVISVIPESFQEYPDHISVIMFFAGCNFRCSYCYNYDAISDTSKALPETPEALLDKVVSPLTDGLVLLGGEPTIYKHHLLDFASYAKKKYSLAVKLFTNGSNRDIVTEGLKNGLIDNVSIDFKFALAMSSPVDFKKTGMSALTYLGNMLTLLSQLYYSGYSNKVEVRTTQFNGMSDEEVGLIKSFCDDYGIKHITQLDVSDSYRRLGVLNG